MYKEFTFGEMKEQMFVKGKPMDLVKGELFWVKFPDDWEKRITLFRCTKNKIKKNGAFSFKMKEVR